MPLLAALFPIVSGTRVSVREAMDDYGVEQGQFGGGLVDRLAERVRGLPAPLLLGVRNTFRRKGRLALTLVALTLAGAIFVAVTSVQASLDLTLENLLKYWQFDAQVQLTRPYRISRIERVASGIPGVVNVECWGVADAYRLRPDGSEGESIYLYAPPAETAMIEPVLMQGRWLLAGDENAVVVTAYLLAGEPDLALGDEIVLKIGEREAGWRIVGVVQMPQPVSIAYVNYPAFARQIRDAGQASIVNVMAEGHDEGAHQNLAEALEEQFVHAGMGVASILTLSRARESTEVYFSIIVTLLMAMAILLATVGGLSLAGMMGINVLERTREIGVMRAIGASDSALLEVFVTEGVVVGLLSWTMGIPAALGLGKLLSHAVGMQFLRAPLSYRFSAQGALLWLVLVALLSAVATLIPARDGARVSVRQTLAYE